MKYYVVTYAGGKSMKEIKTTKFKEVQEEYKKSIAGAVAVRVWMNGEKLPYSVSNKMFDSKRDLVNTAFVGRCFGLSEGRNYCAV